jgi:peptidoglycan/LPS O-acetylase OafA/YrhL
LAKIYSNTKHSLNYNPYLDGLRGVAILLVVLFHVWPDYFSFGYVWVDTFFVISGFLITQIIFTKLEKNSFSFKEFYRNRIRRLFPALIILLITALVVGYLFLFPDEYTQLARHIKSSALYYENFRLIEEKSDYWDVEAIFKPLLHLWSLSIEEQFYIFWPFIIYLLYRFKKFISLNFFIIFSILLGFSVFLNVDKFYHTLSRAWELAFGGFIFILSYQYKEFMNKILDKKWFAVGVVILFIFSIALSSNNNSYNIFKTFLIVLSSGLLILALTYSKERFFFGNTFLVSIGIISYSLYLWHYMIISFGAIFGYDIRSFWAGLTIIAVSIILAFLTYRFVEFYTRSIESYKFAVALFFTMIIIALIGQYIYVKDGLPDRPQFKSPVYSYFQKQLAEPPRVDEKGLALISKVSEYTSPSDLKFIRSTSNDISKRYVLIIGDSHAQMAYPALAFYLKKYDYETILLGSSGCFPSINNPAVGNDDIEKRLTECKETINTISKLIENKDIRISKVIFITRGPVYMYGKGFGEVEKNVETYFESFYKNPTNYDQKREFIKALNFTFKYFDERNIKLYYVIDNPELGFLPEKKCMPRPFNIFPQNNCRITLESYLKRASEYRNIVYSLAKNYKNVVVLDPINVFCDEKYCYAMKNGKLLYRDDDHLSLDGTFELAKFLIDKIVSESVSH